MVPHIVVPYEAAAKRAEMASEEAGKSAYKGISVSLYLFPYFPVYTKIAQNAHSGPLRAPKMPLSKYQVLINEFKITRVRTKH